MGHDFDGKFGQYKDWCRRNGDLTEHGGFNTLCFLDNDVLVSTGVSNEDMPVTIDVQFDHGAVGAKFEDVEVGVNWPGSHVSIPSSEAMPSNIDDAIAASNGFTGWIVSADESGPWLE